MSPYARAVKSAAALIMAIQSLIVKSQSLPFNLDSILLKDILPPSSPKCLGPNNGNFSSTLKFSRSPSYWDPGDLPFEPPLYLVEMTHTDPNPNRTWSMRIGTGGDIYSFVGAFGEAVPPQANPQHAPWIDEVWQNVVVNAEENQKGNLFFVHQSGSYMMDGELTPPPVYSPNVARHCEDRECSFVSWGQMSIIPTSNKSPVLYITRYRDCGEGVIEHTSMIHNMDDVHSPDSNHFTFNNVPWGGVRSSTLQSVLFSNSTGDLNWEFPLSFFGMSINLKAFQDTAGYTAFAQGLEQPTDAAFPKQCTEANIQHCETWGWYGDIQLKLIVAGDDTCKRVYDGFAQARGLYGVSLAIEPTTVIPKGCPVCRLKFTNARTGEYIVATDVVSWASNGNDLRFCPKSPVTEKEINDIFKGGDEITVDYAYGMPYDDNLAMTFIHGVDRESGETEKDWIFVPSKERWGLSGNSRRDYTVLEQILFVDIGPQDTYMKRQYMLTDQLSTVPQNAKPWVDEVYQDFFKLGEHFISTAIHIYHSPLSSSFGASTQPSCSAAQKVCTGDSTPQIGAKALFAIRCDDTSYIGIDLYHFDDTNDEFHRSYVCDGMGPSVRPVRKLLGYFVEGDCDVVQGLSYDPEFCDVHVASVKVLRNLDGNEA